MGLPDSIKNELNEFDQQICEYLNLESKDDEIISNLIQDDLLNFNVEVKDENDQENKQTQ